MEGTYAFNFHLFTFYRKGNFPTVIFLLIILLADLILTNLRSKIALIWSSAWIRGFIRFLFFRGDPPGVRISD